MACYHPIKGYRAPGGQIKFSRPGAYVDLPITIACGQCSGCRLERSRQWAVRCMHEAQMHERSAFLTLTYDEKNLPENRSLQVSDWQSFAKRMRKKIGPFRFFHCGEYGEINGRPHYHAALFGANFQHDRKIWKQTSAGDTLFISATLEELWPMGFSTLGELTFQSAAYVARYVMKKVTGSRAEDHYARVNKQTGECYSLTPEYTTMSRRPGIGKTWIDKYMTDVYPSDQCVVNGKITRPPKFYDQQLEKHDKNMFLKLKATRLKNGSKHEENNTYDRLAVREEVQKAKIRELTREI